MHPGLILISRNTLDEVYGPDERAAISGRVRLVSEPVDSRAISNNLSLLRDVEVLFSGWGAPTLDKAFLDHAPRLKIVFYGGGSVRHLVNDDFWSRGIRITSAYGMNGVSVADYIVGALLFGLKRGFHYARHARQHGCHASKQPGAGTYESIVGVISLGAVGRALIARLRPFNLKLIAYDPFCSTDRAAELGIELVSLDDIFSRSDAVTLNTPRLPETIGMVRGEHFARMKPGAMFINTASGLLVRELEMIDVLRKRSDLTAILDVTSPEPPQPGSPLFAMDNVVLTPHIAGAFGRERRGIGRVMVDELDRWIRGEPLQWEITRESIVRMA